MKTLAILSVALFSTGTTALAETYWSAGVSQEQGWYDFDKKCYDSESEMCWAICAANLIAWWQNAQPQQSLPANVPTGKEVWQTYRNSFTNEGSDPDQGMRWWFSGKYEPTRPVTGEPCAAITTEKTGSYYKDRAGEGDRFLWDLLYRGRGEQVNKATLSKAFFDGFKQGDAFWVGVAYYRSNGARYTHSLSVWGIDAELKADGSPQIKAIYMTDSDDGGKCLHRIPIKEESGMLKFDCPQHPLYGQIGDITITNYTGMKHHLP